MKKLLITCIIALSLTGCFVEQGAQMANEVAAETLTGTNAIENYEWFKSMEQRIKARYKDEVVAQAAIDRYKERIDMKNLTDSQSGELSRLEMNLDALRYSVNEMVADYEARSSMANRALFKDNLPTNIVRGVNDALEFKYNVRATALEKVSGGKN